MNSRSLESNFVQRVARLPKPRTTADALLPLFEAISNSIQACQEKFKDAVSKHGQIVVTVRTNRKKENVYAIVDDNGIGLNEQNWEAFCTTDTDKKINIGGKGVGRLLWLDCFETINISSTYRDKKRYRKRSFDFVLKQKDQIENEREIDITSTDASTPKTGFRVRFSNPRDNGYLNSFPGRESYVFQHFVSHFLPPLIGGRSPRITLHVNDESQEYPQAVAEIVQRKSEPYTMQSKKYGDLRLVLMECKKEASAELKGLHFVHFIAHDRTVCSQRIDGKLGLKAFGEREDSVFHGVLTGGYLDDNVNQERTAFQFGDAEIENIINNVCWNTIKEFLDEPLRSLNEQQQNIIKKITETYPSVSFGSMEELQEKVPAGEKKPDAVYGHLARERFRRDEKQHEKIRTVLTGLKSGGVSGDDFIQAIKDANDAIEESEQKSLAEYVVRRKVILDFMELLLKRVSDVEKDSSYQKEHILHTLICPLRIETLPGGDKKTQPASHDLWVIDERLAFTRYFSSDVPVSQTFENSENKERPDLLIFDKVHALREKPDSQRILLVEFKRPGLKKYDRDPVEQVMDYVEKLQGSQVRGLTDVDGRTIKLDQDTLFYCYIVADILGDFARSRHIFTAPPSPDGRGKIIQPGAGFRGFIEVVGWDTLLSDAKERNKAFFEGLGLSGKNFFSPD